MKKGSLKKYLLPNLPYLFMAWGCLSAFPHRTAETRGNQHHSGEEGAMADTATKEEYTYQIDKIKFIVTPVYKEEGETMGDILLKLMLAELDPA